MSDALKWLGKATVVNGVWGAAVGLDLWWVPFRPLPEWWWMVCVAAGVAAGVGWLVVAWQRFRRAVRAQSLPAGERHGGGATREGCTPWPLAVSWFATVLWTEPSGAPVLAVLTLLAMGWLLGVVLFGKGPRAGRVRFAGMLLFFSVAPLTRIWLGWVR